MIFYLVQNWEKEYPELEPYMVIDLINKNAHFSTCDEHGISDFLGGYKEMHFLPANEDVVWAFLGETQIENNKTFLIVKQKERGGVNIVG